ncbi:MAG: hypothetical protein LC138_07240 [Anaerolineales bacterium]|jgi:D-alanyl-lipoteichoic acid acyltransferase DltB (MBOAT superfamily)|nr:hypothetical protein [Anaerolineales bacterium]OQY87067.1 MAG: hypothetical protein B6D40_00235 [Anaerolineae bacterium UTCFX3]WKZ51148.1 MAG: MBOAT family O-acyltransferase [Anaerolineales bacterium]
MSLVNILLALGLSVALGLAFRSKGRVYALAIVSVAALYWLQPDLKINGHEIFLPTLVLGLVLLSWGLVTDAEARAHRENLLAGLGVIGLVAILEAVSRLDMNVAWFNPSPAPGLPTALLVLAGIVSLAILSAPRLKPAGIWVLLVTLVALFVLIKLPAVSSAMALSLHKISLHLPGLEASFLPRFDLRWFGFSYIAFRLIHTLRDCQAGRLPQVSLAEYVTYVVFFPALAAGPIDRVERFVKDLRQPLALDSAGWLEAGQRIMLGLFKKFVLADSLAVFALSATNASQIRTAGWMWLYIYAYTFLIYFDFSGYTDIAIGLGRLMGIKLPENFNAPYLKPNLTQFWNNWHMTLTQWFRAYFFNPLTRWLRSEIKLPVWSIIFVAQIATMILIGLWHGIAWNFVIWGLWHGLGLFIQNRWSESIHPRLAGWLLTPVRQKIIEGLGILVTFHFVSLGWIFFALPKPGQALSVFAKLFGVN